MPRFSTALKLSQTALPLNMLVVLALVFVFASGLTPGLIPWGVIGLDLLLLGTLIVNLSAVYVMPVNRRTRMRLVRRLTIGLDVLAATFLMAVSIGVAFGLDSSLWREFFSWKYELGVALIIGLNMSLLASVGRH